MIISTKAEQKECHKVIFQVDGQGDCAEKGQPSTAFMKTQAAL